MAQLATVGAGWRRWKYSMDNSIWRFSRPNAPWQSALPNIIGDRNSLLWAFAFLVVLLLWSWSCHISWNSELSCILRKSRSQQPSRRRGTDLQNVVKKAWTTSWSHGISSLSLLPIQLLYLLALSRLFWLQRFSPYLVLGTALCQSFHGSVCRPCGSEVWQRSTLASWVQIWKNTFKLFSLSLFFCRRKCTQSATVYVDAQIWFCCPRLPDCVWCHLV